MSGLSDLLIDGMASLLPTTTAGACVGFSSWMVSDHKSPNGRYWHKMCHYTNCAGTAFTCAWKGPFTW